MASITMHLSSYRILLPAAAAGDDAKYEALTELDLSGAAFDEDAPGGGGRTLGGFVSSCCPRLRKLDICFPKGLPQLVIRSETLEELRLSQADGLRTLDVAAPSLRVLKLEHCFHDTMRLLAMSDDGARDDHPKSGQDCGADAEAGGDRNIPCHRQASEAGHT
jgi:hypothetical protein